MNNANTHTTNITLIALAVCEALQCIIYVFVIGWLAGWLMDWLPSGVGVNWRPVDEVLHLGVTINSWFIMFQNPKFMVYHCFLQSKYLQRRWLLVNPPHTMVLSWFRIYIECIVNIWSHPNLIVCQFVFYFSHFRHIKTIKTQGVFDKKHVGGIPWPKALWSRHDSGSLWGWFGPNTWCKVGSHQHLPRTKAGNQRNVLTISVMIVMWP